MKAAERRPRGISLNLALLALVAAAFLAGIVPAGVVLERWVKRELESRVQADLALAPRLLADRTASVGDAMMMHAKDVAHAPGLAEALSRASRADAVRQADAAARELKSLAVLVGGDGASWAGPAPPAAMLDATRRGEMPVRVVSDGGALYTVSIAPVALDGWLGAAGVATPLDEGAAGALAALTRSDVVIVRADDGSHVASRPVSGVEREISRAIGGDTLPGGVRALAIDGQRYLYSVAPVPGARVAFVRDVRGALALLGPLRLGLAVSGVVALALALLLGSVLARGIARPVRVLADAAGRLSRGDFGAPLAGARVREITLVTSAFGEMRAALAAHLRELRDANRLLEERQVRLVALQAELIRRERVATSGRMVVELAHEIRNPVANLRNCLELLHRRLDADPEGREYASLAIDELLRMHELAERMLHLNRPRDPSIGHCDAGAVAHEVASLARIGTEPTELELRVEAADPVVAAIPPDALKQVLLNLVQNAREARSCGLELTIRIEREERSAVILVRDNGPGIPAAVRSRIFDPFFTTRTEAGGIGLGLFVAEGIVRGHGGTVGLADTPAGGASFRITLPAVPAPETLASAPPPAVQPRP